MGGQFGVICLNVTRTQLGPALVADYVTLLGDPKANASRLTNVKSCVSLPLKSQLYESGKTRKLTCFMCDNGGKLGKALDFKVSNFSNEILYLRN